MGVRVTAAALIIVCIIVFGVLALNRVDDIIGSIADNVTLAKSTALPGERALYIEAGYKYIEDNRYLLSSIIPHDQLRQLCLSFERAAAFAKTESEDELLASINEILFLAETIRLFDRPNLLSIF